MKNRNLVLLLFSVFIFSFNINSAISSTCSIRQMEIQGGLLDMAAYSIKPELEICYDINNIYIQYNHSFGLLNVSIEDNTTGMTVSEEYINVTEGTYQVIDISGLEEGMYTIYITNSKNKCVSGTFEVN